MGAYFVLYPRARVLIWFPPIFHLPDPGLADARLLGRNSILSRRSYRIAETTQTSGIAVWRHVGGFVVGILLIRLFPERPHRYRYGAW